MLSSIILKKPQNFLDKTLHLKHELSFYRSFNIHKDDATALCLKPKIFLSGHQ